MKIPDNIKGLMQKLLDNNYEVYIIGGAVRDWVMGITPHDYDLFTNATGEAILSIFPEGHIIGNEERQNKILTVIIDGVEVSQYRRNGKRTEVGINLLEHLATCDFTMNAMACDINGNVIDPHSGQFDLSWNRIMFVGRDEDRVNEDPLRLFRGIRFAVKYNLNIQQQIVFKESEKYIKDIPKERIRDEFLKIISLPQGLALLNNFGILGNIMPQWKKLQGIDGGLHHNETIDKHSIIAGERAITLTNNSLLIMATYFHDIGKPDSLPINTIDISKMERDTPIPTEITFYEHHIIGAEIMRNWMNEYKFSIDNIRYVTTIIKHHMMGKTGEIKQSRFAKICQELTEAHIPPEDMLVVTYCDNQSNLLHQRICYNEFIKGNGFLDRWYKTYYEQKGFTENSLEISGKDLIALGYIEGKTIGIMKKMLFDLVCEGALVNRKDRLLEYAKIQKRDPTGRCSKCGYMEGSEWSE